MGVEAKGEIAALADTLNSMTKTLGIFAEQVTSVARTVGVEGKLGAQAAVPGVAGTWKDLTDNVNLLANNLTAQVRNIAEVTTSVAKGDLSKKITVDAKGEVLELKNTINTMVDQLNAFASEVTRVAREVGTEGRLGGQADVRGVSGTWKDLTDNVNVLAGNLTDQCATSPRFRRLSPTATSAEDHGRSARRDPRVEEHHQHHGGPAPVVCRRSDARRQGSRHRGKARRTGHGARRLRHVEGLDRQRQFHGVEPDEPGAQYRPRHDGHRERRPLQDHGRRQGRDPELKNTINTMVDQLNSFAAEVTRVAREVGSEGRLGGQAEVRGVAGTWKDLTDNVNFMARNLTTQVRGIVKVVTAVANGDLKQRLVVEAKGEVAALAETINSMTETLGTFAEQVSTVAREVGVEGKLGGQARPVAGTWKDLTDNAQPRWHPT